LEKRILITGGAGFIGSHLADELLRYGYKVRALDNLSPQVHGVKCFRPDYLDPEVELITGDVRDLQTVRQALRGVDAIYHFAAMVGVGQSMYEITQYTDVNNVGTAVLLEAIAKRPVERLIVASSMSIYGEGLYQTSDGKTAIASERNLNQLRAKKWEVRNEDGEILRPIATPENKPLSFASVYALSKYDQERLCLMIGRAYNIPTVALRFFNAYGPRQALSNPYTGVLAIFASRLLNSQPPLVFEDGFQQRDFVNVRDIARACRLALEADRASYGVFNIGSGQPTTIRNIAALIARAIGKRAIQPEITGHYRMGDIRHCFADITQARTVLGYEPQVSLEKGLQELSSWIEGQKAVDYSVEARRELEARGLTV